MKGLDQMHVFLLLSLMSSTGRCSLKKDDQDELAGKNAVHLLQHWRQIEMCLERQRWVGVDAACTATCVAAAEFRQHGAGRSGAWELHGGGSVSWSRTAGQQPLESWELGWGESSHGGFLDEKGNTRRKMSFRLISV